MISLIAMCYSREIDLFISKERKRGNSEERKERQLGEVEIAANLIYVDEPLP